MFFLAELNFFLAIVGLVMAVATVVLVVDYFFYQGKYLGEQVIKFAWPIAILLTTGSVALSLLYSEYYGFVPCSLCWLQRIAIYPQALMAILAFQVKDTQHFPVYGIGLSIFGFLVAVYQYFYQMLPRESVVSEVAPCLLDSFDADCAVKVIDEFGFVTFPFLSAVTFAFLILIYLYWRRSHSVL